MESIENLNLTGAVVVIDGKHFNNCRFERCTVIYGGGDFAWSNTQFINCQLSFEAAAARTLQYLKYFNMVPQQQPATPSGQPPPTTTVH
jgi:hypothetical protein